MRRGLVLALLVALGALFGVGVASGHAVLEDTSPADGAVVATSPPRVTLSFGEDVTLVPAAVRVYDAGLREVDDGAAGHVDGNPRTAEVGLRPGLPAGTYSVTWRVVSADSHPVQGGFRFSIGHPGPAGAVPEAAPGSGSGSVGVLLAVARFVEYAGLAGLGGVLTLEWLRGAGSPNERRARRPVVGGWWLLLVGTVAAVLLQGPDAQGLGVLSALDPSVFASTAASPTGVLALTRLGLLLLLAAPGARLFPHTTEGRRLPDPVTTAAGLALIVTFSLGGHAGVGPWAPLGVIVDAAHALAMALWVGGLAVLGAVLTPRVLTPAEAGPMAVVLPRFSRLAQGAVAVVVMTGLYQTWRDVATPAALLGTSYGLLLLAKVVLVVALLAFGNRARIAVARRVAGRAAPPARRRAFALPLGPPTEDAAAAADGAPRPQPDAQPEPQPDPHAVPALRRGLLTEVALAVLVLAVTSVLVATPQAAESYAPPVTDVQRAGGLVLTARVDAAHTGTTTLHLAGTDPTGRPLPLTLVEATASLPAHQIGPLPLPVAGPGAPTLPLSFAVPGMWALNVTVATPATTPTAFRVEVPVR